MIRIVYVIVHLLCGKEKPGLIGKLGHHVGILGVREIEASVAVCQVLGEVSLWSNLPATSR